MWSFPVRRQNGPNCGEMRLDRFLQRTKVKRRRNTFGGFTYIISTYPHQCKLNGYGGQKLNGQHGIERLSILNKNYSWRKKGKL